MLSIKSIQFAKQIFLIKCLVFPGMALVMIMFVFLSHLIELIFET